MKKILILLFLVLQSVWSVAQTLSSEEQKLYDLIMQYRKKHKLPAIPLSKELSKVAKLHAQDLAEHYTMNKNCNMHSWSNKGAWNACCYDNKHSDMGCMQNKPRELSLYKGNGYEIVHGGAAPYLATAELSLAGWQKSVHHNNVIMNKDIWKKITWNAIGIGMYQGYATVWFGMEKE